MAQVVERYLGVVEAVGSSPATQTSLTLDSISFGSGAIFLSGPSIDKKDAFSVFLLSGSEPVCAEGLFYLNMLKIIEGIIFV